MNENPEGTVNEREDRLSLGRKMRERIMGPGVAPGTPATQELAPFFSR